ncbi:hypothetical protein NE452_18570, partial [Paeniclostridium sordellii]|uniref:hypothetical protein n=1 Tax=Paraclostridium sordellii TaxID=1505 RepID=UPI00210EDA23
IPGVQISTIKNTRIYNGGEAIGSLIGHIGNITKEQLKENKGKDYNEYSKIGIGGIEEVYESKLRAIIMVGILNALAMEDAPFTKKSADLISIINP